MKVRTVPQPVVMFYLIGCAVLFQCVAAPVATVAAQVRSANEPISKRVPDLPVIDQDGKALRFYSDLVRDKVVVINFIFTSCNLVCPMLGNSFSRLQESLAGRLGRDVYLITISTDPTTDTPARMRAWADRFSAKRGWTLVTGDAQSIDELLLSLTGTKSGRSEHNPGVLIINDRSGLMIRDNGLGEPQKLISAIDGAR